MINPRSIKIEDTTKKRLDEKKIIPNETYDSVITKLLNYASTRTVLGTV